MSLQDYINRKEKEFQSRREIGQQDLDNYIRHKLDITKCLYARRMPNGFLVGCGHCSTCRKQYAREMAFRVEAEAYDKYCYNVLLTYNDEHLPRLNGRPVLNRVHVQDFLKRFRSWHDKYTGTKLRFFGVGEYGGKKGRPHYHLIFFTDKPLEMPKDDHCEPLSFINGILKEKWQKGIADIERINNAGSATIYLTQYLLTYDKKDNDTLVKPFRMMTRGGRKDKGLGYRWLERTRPLQKYCIKYDDFTMSTISEDGRKFVRPIPRYYKRKFVPEEIRIAKADEQFYKCQNLIEIYSNIPNYEKIKYSFELHKLQQREREQQEREYRLRKVHESNRSAHRFFVGASQKRQS